MATKVPNHGLEHGVFTGSIQAFKRSPSILAQSFMISPDGLDISGKIDHNRSNTPVRHFVWVPFFPPIRRMQRAFWALRQ